MPWGFFYYGTAEICLGRESPAALSPYTLPYYKMHHSQVLLVDKEKHFCLMCLICIKLPVTTLRAGRKGCIWGEIISQQQRNCIVCRMSCA